MDHDAWQHAHESDGLVAKVEIIQEMKRRLLGDDRARGRLLTEDDLITPERMAAFAEWCIANIVDIDMKFALRDETTTMAQVAKAGKNIFNRVQSVWGFAKLEKDSNRVRARIGGKMADVTPYRIVPSMGSLSLRMIDKLTRGH
jgi:hypothetical protein